MDMSDAYDDTTVEKKKDVSRNEIDSVPVKPRRLTMGSRGGIPTFQ